MRYLFIIIPFTILVFPAMLSAQKTGYIIVRPSAVVRAKPTVNSAPIASLQYGTKVQIKKNTNKEEFLLGIKGSWLEVQTSGKKGYIFSPLVSEKKSGALKIAQGILVHESFSMQSNPEEYEGFPLPPEDCRSLEDYALKTFQSSGNVRLFEQTEGAISTRIISYENGIESNDGWQLSEIKMEGLKLPLAAKPALQKILAQCTVFRSKHPIPVPFNFQVCNPSSSQWLTIKEEDSMLVISTYDDGGGSCGPL